MASVAGVGEKKQACQHAAVAMAEGCTWVSRDRDFSRFAPHGLKWEHLVLD